MDSQPEGTSILERIYAGVNVYYNYTGTVGCFDLNYDPHGMGGWDWQVLKPQSKTVSIYCISLIYAEILYYVAYGSFLVETGLY
jgi:hypothetical protein